MNDHLRSHLRIGTLVVTTTNIIRAAIWDCDPYRWIP